MRWRSDNTPELHYRDLPPHVNRKVRCDGIVACTSKSAQCCDAAFTWLHKFARRVRPACTIPPFFSPTRRGADYTELHAVSRAHRQARSNFNARFAELGACVE